MRSILGDVGPTPANTRSTELAAAAVGCIGADNFAAAALERMHRALALGAWTVYRVRRDAPPEFALGATRGRRDITGACWEQYRAGLYLSDSSFAAMLAQRGARVAVSRIDPAQLDPAHRAAIYERHGIQERLSLVVVERPGELLALNFYRFLGQRWFNEEEECGLRSASAVLLAAVRKHLELRCAPRPLLTAAAVPELEVSVLRERCPALTERELEVCMGLVQGISFDGIAARLNVSATTVKTYRNRAFRRLGINHRNQLYGVCVTGMVQKTDGIGSLHV